LSIVLRPEFRFEKVAVAIAIDVEVAIAVAVADDSVAVAVGFLATSLKFASSVWISRTSFERHSDSWRRLTIWRPTC
jgi:hypothetical protein